MEGHWHIGPFVVQCVPTGYNIWRRRLSEDEILSFVLPWAELLALYQVLDQVVRVHVAEQQQEGGAK